MKFKIIFSLIFVAALGVLAYFAYPIVKERYFNNEEQETQKADTNKNNAETNYEIRNQTTDNKNEIDNQENSATEDSIPSDEVKDETDETGVSENITAEDCDNECTNFKDDASNLKYCQNVCDISPIKDSENCEEKQGSDKDYCFKNQAVAKTDLNICNSISDAKIKSSCKNRVTEDLLENQL